MEGTAGTTFPRTRAGTQSGCQAQPTGAARGWGSHPHLQPSQIVVTQLDLPSPGISKGQGESLRRKPASMVALGPLQPLLGPEQGGTAAKNWVCSPLDWLQEMLSEECLPAQTKDAKRKTLPCAPLGIVLQC